MTLQKLKLSNKKKKKLNIKKSQKNSEQNY